jgi:hypothetical protein
MVVEAKTGRNLQPKCKAMLKLYYLVVVGRKTPFVYWTCAPCGTHGQLFGLLTQTLHSEGASLKKMLEILLKTSSVCLLGLQFG